jgi:hypothetical protein
MSKTCATVMKGQDVEQTARILRSKYDRFVDPIVVSLDMTKLDACTGLQHLRYQYSVYKAVYPGDSTFAWMLKTMLKYVAVAYCPDGIVRLRTAARKASGDVDTSLGNVINVLRVFYKIVQRLKIRIELANNGDDNLVFLERSDFSLLKTYLQFAFIEAGFILKIEGVYAEFEDIIFCQHTPVLIGGVWRMVREVRTVISKDTMCLVHCPTEQLYRKWLAAVASAGMHLCDGVPVLESFYRCLRRNGSTCTDRFFRHVMQRTHFVQRATIRHETVTDEARVSFHASSGLLPDEQLQLEWFFDRFVIDKWQDEIIEQNMLPQNQGWHLDILQN